MSASDTEATVRRLYRAYADQDGPALLELFADDLVLHASGRNPLSGDYLGREQVFSYFGKVGAWTGGEGGFEINAVLCDENGHAAATVTGTTAHDGQPFERQLVHLFTIRDGKIVDFRDLPFDQHVEDAFWTGT